MHEHKTDHHGLERFNLLLRAYWCLLHALCLKPFRQLISPSSQTSFRFSILHSMSHHTETATTWNKLANLYQERFMDLTIYNNSYDAFCDAITTPNPRILEIGCGPGNITKYLLSRRPDFTVDGIDIAPNMIALARKNNPGASFSVMDCRNILQLPNRYDGMIGGFCLPYLTEKDCIKLFADISNMLTDGGLVYISFVEGTPDQSGFQTNSEGDRMYFTYYTLEHITHQLLLNGFEQPTILTVNYSKRDETIEVHTIVLARKGAI